VISFLFFTFRFLFFTFRFSFCTFPFLFYTFRFSLGNFKLYYENQNQNLIITFENENQKNKNQNQNLIITFENENQKNKNKNQNQKHKNKNQNQNRQRRPSCFAGGSIWRIKVSIRRSAALLTTLAQVNYLNIPPLIALNHKLYVFSTHLLILRLKLWKSR